MYIKNDSPWLNFKYSNWKCNMKTEINKSLIMLTRNEHRSGVPFSTEIDSPPKSQSSVKVLHQNKSYNPSRSVSALIEITATYPSQTWSTPSQLWHHCRDLQLQMVCPCDPCRHSWMCRHPRHARVDQPGRYMKPKLAYAELNRLQVTPLKKIMFSTRYVICMCVSLCIYIWIYVYVPMYICICIQCI